jgi:hypothetical protein
MVLGESVSALSLSLPLGARPPVGTCQVTGNHRCWTRVRRPRIKICLRKECCRKYHPWSWNQRYCQELECLRQVRRWQAAGRQAKRRQDDDVRAQHAEAEKERRQRIKIVSQTVVDTEVAPARGHADETSPPSALRSARLLRTPRDVGPQPGTLSLGHVSSSDSQRQGP